MLAEDQPRPCRHRVVSGAQTTLRTDVCRRDGGVHLSLAPHREQSKVYSTVRPRDSLERSRFPEGRRGKFPLTTRTLNRQGLKAGSLNPRHANPFLGLSRIPFVSLKEVARPWRSWRFGGSIIVFMLGIKQGRFHGEHRKCHAARHLSVYGKAAIRHFLTRLAWFLGYPGICVTLKRAPTLFPGTTRRGLGSRWGTPGKHWLDGVEGGWQPLQAKV